MNNKDITIHYDDYKKLMIVKQGSNVIAEMDFNKFTPYQNLAVTLDVLKENLPNANQKTRDVKVIHYICKAMKLLNDGTLNITYHR